MKKNKKKFTIFIGITSLLVLLMHIINKFIFFLSTIKEVLYSNNSNYYNWRFGKVFYTKKGSGTPLLLIHDLNCTSSDYEWKEVATSLSENHTVYTIDLLGCGRSDKPKMTYTNYLYVQLITDFIKNVIKHKTDIVATGNSSSIVIMACYADNKLFNKIMLINPDDIKSMNNYPRYKNKLLKYIIDSPILGTFIYNIIVSKSIIKNNFKNNYFYNDLSIRNKYINAYYEAAHLSGSSSKYMYSSIKSHYTNVNIIHALKELNQSIYLIGGAMKPDNKAIFEEYLSYNPSIETAFIENTKQLPQLEKPSDIIKLCDIFL